MNKITKSFLDAVWYLVAFVLIQVVVQFAAAFIWASVKGQSLDAVLLGMTNGVYGGLMVTTTAISSLLTILLFTLLRWTPVSRNWLATRPWLVIVWVVLLTFGTILPAEWIYEQLQLAMPEQTVALFQSIMREPWGYLVVGMLVPVAEELVFRGAVLRVLLNVFARRSHWIAIAISAVVFGIIHMNLAQGFHATLIGLLLGWMYYRTRSVFPGIVLHWINNTVAYVMFNIQPQLADGQLIDLFHGDRSMLYMAIGFSLCIFLPSLYQLAIRMKEK
jgi:membrane protease YdiL (CAAX protease family)